MFVRSLGTVSRQYTSCLQGWEVKSHVFVERQETQKGSQDNPGLRGGAAAVITTGLGRGEICQFLVSLAFSLSHSSVHFSTYLHQLARF